LLHKLKEGDIDGLTLVYTTGMAEWKKASDVDELREELRKINEQEAAMEAAMNASSANDLNTNSIGNQIFVPDADDEVQQAAKAYFQKSKPKNFVADDGTKYKWDEEEQDWVVDDEASQEEDMDGGDNGKRKHDDSDSDNEDDEEEDGNAQQSGEKSDNVGDGREKKKRKKRKKQKQANTWVYVSGLPPDVTFEELKEHFSKVSIIEYFIYCSDSIY
jgi:hypothetical protein